METKLWLKQKWIDYNLNWVPAEFGGISYVRIPAERIWRPDIVLYNTAEENFQFRVIARIEEFTRNKVILILINFRVRSKYHNFMLAVHLRFKI